MNVYKYESYREYLKVQRKTYKAKEDRVWARRDIIDAIADEIKPIEPKRGICHGVRTGEEVRWFAEALGCEVVGTELGRARKNVVKWDFNKPNSDWFNAFDFVYSNSFDHAYSPVDTMLVWQGQLIAGGMLIIEHSYKHEKAEYTDPFGATVDEVAHMMSGYFDVRTVELERFERKYRTAIIGVN